MNDVTHAAASGVAHGGVAAAELHALGLDRADVLDLSANLHPLGPHPEVLGAAREADLRHYPEPDARTARAAFAQASGLDAAQLLVVPGATAALHLAARVLLRPGDDCALWPPAFGEYAAAAVAAGAHIVQHTTAPPDFAPLLDVPAAPLGIVGNPNNPTGRYLARTDVERIAAALRGTLVLDVAYDAFVAGAWDADALVRDGHDVLVVHSLTKLHATPGLRIGYVTGAPALIARLEALLPSWSVGASELAAVGAMLSAEATQRTVVARLVEVRAELAAALTGLGFAVTPAAANFVLVHVGDARAFRLALLRRGFAVRDCASFGLPEHVRIAVPPPAATARLLRAVRALREESP